MEEFPEGFELETLLAPITDEAPAGEDLREDYEPNSLYYRLRDARSEARAAERAAEGSDDDSASPPEWNTVYDLAYEALATRTKDLEIAAWLTEALLRRDGLVGLTAGCRLMAGLTEAFWDTLFPLPDDEGIVTRVAPIAGLNGTGGGSSEGTLLQPLRKTALFARPDGAPFSCWQYEQSEALATITDETRRQARLDAGVVPFDTVETEARREGSALGEVRQQCEAAAAAWATLAGMLDERAGRDSPPSSAVAGVLEKIREVAARYAVDAAPADEPGDAPIAEAEAAPAEGGAAAAGAGATAAVAGSVNSREDALRSLAQLANFFRRTEPMSPLAYTLEEAVRRARLSWPELLEEIVPDLSSRSAILTSLGIRPPPSEC